MGCQNQEDARVWGLTELLEGQVLFPEMRKRTGGVQPEAAGMAAIGTIASTCQAPGMDLYDR